MLVRKSGTEPVVRVMVEAENMEECKLKAEQIADYLTKNCG